MLIVETYLNVSPGKGIGLFAKCDLIKGQKYWIRNEVFDKIIPASLLESFDKVAYNYVVEHGFLEKSGNWYLCCDNASFTNHSSNPNSENHFDSQGLILFITASSYIYAGEEILCDYTDTCLTCQEGVNFE